MHPHPRRRTLRRSRMYWLCQCLGWGGYGVLYYLVVLIPVHASGWRNALADAVYCLIGLIGAHLLHVRLRRHRWPDLPPRRLLPRLVLAALVIAAGMTAGLEASFLALGLTKVLPLWPFTPIIAFFTAGLVGVWLAIYWLILGARRRRAAETNALQSQLLARNAELSRLQAQLNPHFLFNCLNSLRALILEDPARAQAMVTQLSELLRYALRADRAATVPLAEEWAAIEAYLALEGLRLEDRLRCEHTIPAAALAAAVPPLLLQGLVENAIKHGVAPNAAGGSVRITAVVAGGVLRLEVRNSGGLRTAPMPGEAGHGGFGLGLANARQRLALLYGAAASLRLEESPPGAAMATTAATVTLPYRPAAEAACAP